MKYLTRDALAGLGLTALVLIAFEVVRGRGRGEQEMTVRRFLVVGVPLSAFCLGVALTRDPTAWLSAAGKTIAVGIAAYVLRRGVPALFQRLLAVLDRPTLDELDPRVHPREP